LNNSQIDPAAVVGDDCEIASTAVVGAGVTLERAVTIAPGALVLGPCTIGGTSEIGPRAVLSSGGDSEASLRLEAGVQVMAGAVIAAPVTIARGAIVRPGAVVQSDVPPHAIVAGNPAEIVGYTLSADRAQGDAVESARSHVEGVSTCSVRGVELHRLPRILDLRGNLTVGEFGRSMPFEAKRYFIVFDVPNAEIRGEHAHRTCNQFLICTRGRCSVVVDDGASREEFLLNDPAIGLHIPAMTWGVQYKYSSDAALLVFASEYYDPAEYIRDYAEFLALARGSEPDDDH
jgi:serine acetyltransferase